MAKSGQEVVCEGWLTKSPPTKRVLRAKWRRRWFSLKHSGDIPNQFILTYYTDRNCRKLKGQINLDDLEQVDLGLKLDERKLKFDHVFDIRTPTRIYYLAADTESEMKSWVNCICRVCGLKSTSDDENMHISDIVYHEEDNNSTSTNSTNKQSNETPPISPVSTSPYIPISECITGKTPMLNPQDLKTLLDLNMKNTYHQNQSNHTYDISSQQRNYFNYVNDMQDPRFYDCPRLLSPTSNKHNSVTITAPKKITTSSPPLQSPTDSESVFTDDDGGDVNKIYALKKFTKSAPPRPPKTANSANYMNLGGWGSEKDEGSTTAVVAKKAVNMTMDEMYDFPRSHHQPDSDSLMRSLPRRHCYNNANPVTLQDGQIFRYDCDVSPKPSTSSSQIFRYDLDDLQQQNINNNGKQQQQQDEPGSPLSQGSSNTAYSNLPSPLLLAADGQLMPPPMVNRDLKPRRKLSDSLSLSSNPEPNSPRGAPCVDRKLKPPTPLQEAHMRKSFSDTSKCSPTLSTHEIYNNHAVRKNRPSEDDGGFNRPTTQKIRAAPSPTPPGLGRSHDSLLSSQHDEEIYRHLPGKMQYLDLDLDCGPSSFNGNGLGGVGTKLGAISNNSDTVYKEVDFTKTEAFNLTRNNLEKERSVLNK